MKATTRSKGRAATGFIAARLLDRLRTGPATLRALASELAVSARTLQRAVRALRLKGHRILLVNDGTRSYYRTEEAGDVTPRMGTAGDLLRSPLVGMWADRKDIKSGLQFARRLRKMSERRRA